MTPTYSFKEQNKIGQSGEELIKSYLKMAGFEIIEVDLTTNKTGIDFYAGSLGIEVKTDTQTFKTGNIFIETLSNSNTQKLGWLFTSKCDWVIYLIEQENSFLWIPMDGLRKFIMENPPSAARRVKNKGYESEGFLIKASEIEKYIASREYINI